MIELFDHQRTGIKFLSSHPSAMLCDEMGLGKTRQTLVAAVELFRQRKIDRVLVLAPAAVRISWRDEMNKLGAEPFIPCIYDAKKQLIYGARIQRSETRVPWSLASKNDLPVLIVSYALLPQERHRVALERWCSDGATLLVCDESSFLKNRSAKQAKAAAKISSCCRFRWLLTGTPIANSPLDLYGQSLVMTNGSRGPLSAFKNFWQFQARYAVLKQMKMGPNIAFKQVVGYQNLDELTKRFAPYVLRREKKDCLDLPDKSYVVREVALSEATWKIYVELKREAMLALPDSDARPEPNAAVRILRLCQLTSGHVGSSGFENEGDELAQCRDISDEKLSWLVEEILSGELSNERVLIVWCRWRRERERLKKLLEDARYKTYKDGNGALLFPFYEIYGGQSQKERDEAVQNFQCSSQYMRTVLLAQPHAGGFGLNLTDASTAVFLSNDFSFTTRVQAEDRIHRIGQHHPCLYIDVLACGPNGQRTVDHHIVECLREKKSLADMTCSAWRKVLA